MNDIKWLLEQNAEYAKSYPGAPTMEQMRRDGKTRPFRPFTVTCLDPRSNPEKFFGPQFRSPIFRNAGGRATEDAIRSINTLRWILNITHVLVIHHTDCGVTHLTEEEMREWAKSNNPSAAEEVRKIDFQYFREGQFLDAIKEDVLTLRAQKSLSGVEIHGFALDNATGVLEEVIV